MHGHERSPRSRKQLPARPVLPVKPSLSKPRARWAERWDRPGWRLDFTIAGGRLRRNDPIDVLGDGLALRASRVLSQACFAVSDDGDVPIRTPEVLLWASVVRKLLQRGARPPVSPRAEAVIRQAISQPPADRRQIGAAVSWSNREWRLADEYQLDPTYELPLWNWLTNRAPGIARWVVPQAPLEALAGELDERVSARWVDFIYCAPWLTAPVVIELDGGDPDRGGHHPRRAGADSARDEALRASGFRTARFPGDEVLKEDGRLLSGLRAHAQEWTAESVDMALLGLLHGQAEPARIGLAIVEGVLAGFLQPGVPWTLEVTDDLGLAADLAGVALDPLRAISDLWRCGVVPDEVVVNGRTWLLGGGRASERSGPAGMAPDLRIRLEPTTPYFARLPDRGPMPEVVVRGVGVPVDLAWSPTLTRTRRSIARSEPVDAPLHLLLADVFGHDGFRDGQLGAIRQVLAGGDSVVLLPTGSGKSLIYQLAGLVTPGATIVIDPLVSLIDDQAERLERDGIDRVSAMHAGRMDAPGERDRVLGAMARGESLFVFATPERFQSQRFRDHLTSAASDHLVGIVVVDEAHCVSEWGHDFRTSYLRLARTLRTRCLDRAGSPPPLLALTGTASPAVLRDVVRELEIDERQEGAIQKPANHDRPNLQYEKRRSNEESWGRDVESVLLERLPESFGVSPDRLGACAGTDTMSGIVFTPHVNGRYGAVELAKSVEAAFRRRGAPIETVVYAGRAPEGSESGWAKQRSESVDRFKANEVPLLIGTKAFGMGIDKPNIRYTVHAGLPSSLEAFAQEAGRAGRNGEPAVCTLVAVLPDPEVADQILSLDLSPEERKAAVDRLSDKTGADIRRQGFFLTNSFPGVADETARAIAVLESLGQPPAPGSVITLPLPRTFPGSDKTARRRIEQRRSELDRALYRLAMAGVIEDLTIDGAEVTVRVADWTADSLDAALLDYLVRIEPGRRDAQVAEIAIAASDDMARIEHHVKMLIEATYRIVARARLQALRFMYETAVGSDDPEAIRGRINAYLGGGPVAMALSAAVAAPSIDVRRFVEVMERIALAEQHDLAASAARQLETYPEHPLLLLASALGEARLPQADRTRFKRALTAAMGQFVRYGVTEEEAALGAQWLGKLLRTEHGGRRGAWLVDVLDAWDQAGNSGAHLALIEAAILEDAVRGRVHPDSAVLVRSRRLPRHAAAVTELADRLTPNDMDEAGGGE